MARDRGKAARPGLVVLGNTKQSPRWRGGVEQEEQQVPKQEYDALVRFVKQRPVLWIGPEEFDAESEARRLAERQPLERLDTIAARVLSRLQARAPGDSVPTRQRHRPVPRLRRQPYSQGLRRGARRKAMAHHLEAARVGLPQGHHIVVLAGGQR